MKFLLYLQTIKSGKKLKDAKILYQDATEVSLSSPQKTVIEAEGELQGFLPAKIEIIPKKIRVLR
jgi:Sphingosine kinase and enzymes related to eukaryotic diacylglycerol kinase